jgi:tetratricopeptide (TPR) repeat protein
MKWMRCYIWFVVLVMLVSGCRNFRKAHMADGAYIIRAADTTGDVASILSKSDGFIFNNRMDDAIIYLSANIHRFKGTDKAKLLNARGEAYYLKDNGDNAVTDYLAAIEADPDNPVYVLNTANAYEMASNQANAVFFARKMLEMQNASDSDKEQAQKLIDRCDHSVLNTKPH